MTSSINRSARALAAAAASVLAALAAADDVAPPPYRGEPLSLTAAWEFAQPPANPFFIPPDSFFDVGAESFEPDPVLPHAELDGPWGWLPGDGDGGLTSTGGPGSSFGIAFKLPNWIPPQQQMLLRVQVTYQGPAEPGLAVAGFSVERLFDKPPGGSTLIPFPGALKAAVPVDNEHLYQDWVFVPSWHFTDLQLVVPFGVVLDEVVIDTVLLPQAPANDLCADAIVVHDGTTGFSTLGATDSGPDLPQSCDEGFGTAFVRDVWFVHEPACSGSLLVTACNPDTNFDTRLAVYTGSCGKLSLVACNDDLPDCPVLDIPGFDLLSTVEFDASCGETYYIRLGGYPGPISTGSGTGTLSVICLGGHACADTCPEDLDGNGAVDGGDLGILLAAWGPCPPAGTCPSDLDGSGVVDGGDLGILLAAWGPCPVLCPPSDHNCFETGIPGCTDPDCCIAVCIADPFCCLEAWDALCVNEAEALCDGCGDPQAGDCCSVNSTPFCDNAPCCEQVCAQAPSCCEIAWDQACVALAAQFPECGCGGVECPPSDHDCVTLGPPGCTYIACCEAVCAIEPFCCLVEWDGLCVVTAVNVCEKFACGSPLAGDCCTPHPNEACDNAPCCEAVCLLDPFCCNVSWDELCAGEAATFPICGCG